MPLAYLVSAPSHHSRSCLVSLRHMSSDSSRLAPGRSRPAAAADVAAAAAHEVPSKQFSSHRPPSIGSSSHRHSPVWKAACTPEVRMQRNLCGPHIRGMVSPRREHTAGKIRIRKAKLSSVLIASVSLSRLLFTSMAANHFSCYFTASSYFMPWDSHQLSAKSPSVAGFHDKV